jgi:hypothetical protein
MYKKHYSNTSRNQRNWTIHNPTDEKRSAGGKSLEASVEEAMKMAMEYHQVGRLEEAQTLYKGVLRIRPDHPDALHL